MGNDDFEQRIVDYSDRISELLSQKSDLTGRVRDLEAEVAFWIECTGRAVDALDECAGDDEEGWDRQQHAENAAAQIRKRYKDR
jgi:hypothetical protein